MTRSFKRFTRWMLLCSTLAGAPYALAECTPANQFETITPGVLTVAAYVFPPYSIPGPNNQLSGVDGEIIKRIAERECLKVKTMVVDTAAVIQAVVAKRADVGIGDWYSTVERSKALGLSAPLYLDVMGIISDEGYTKISELDGKRIGTVQGYLWVDDLKKAFGDNLVLYPNPVAMAQDLASKRIQVGADSFAVAASSQLKGGYPGKRIKVAVLAAHEPTANVQDVRVIVYARLKPLLQVLEWRHTYSPRTPKPPSSPLKAPETETYGSGSYHRM